MIINLQLTDIELEALTKKLEREDPLDEDKSIIEDILMKIRMMKYSRVGELKIDSSNLSQEALERFREEWNEMTSLSSHTWIFKENN